MGEPRDDETRWLSTSTTSKRDSDSDILFSPKLEIFIACYESLRVCAILLIKCPVIALAISYDLAPENK